MAQYFPGIHEICDALAREYGSPRHGNKADPLDELFYIILSTRTRGAVFQATFNALQTAYPFWDSITEAEVDRVAAILAPGGLGRLKASQIVAILDQLRAAFGRAALDPLEGMTDDEAEAFLTSLPGVAVKIAKCVMMYSLGRQVLPVDVHVHRVSARLGFRTKKRPDTSQDWIEAAVPPELRYGYHVNAVAHGRAVCISRLPRCRVCCVSEQCEYFAALKGKKCERETSTPYGD